MLRMRSVVAEACRGHLFRPRAVLKIRRDVKISSRLLATTSRKFGQDNEPDKARENDKAMSNREHVRFRSDQLLQADFQTYPGKFDTTHSLTGMRAEFEQVLKTSNSDKSREVRVDGRVHTICKDSEDLFLVDVKSGNHGLQLQLISSEYEGGREQLEKDVNQLRSGDFVGIHGLPSKTKSGEVSLTVRRLSLLSPWLGKMAYNQLCLDNSDERFRHRHLDWLSNPEKKGILDVCDDAVWELRSFLWENGFSEVQTPIMDTKRDGSVAGKFETFHRASQQTMYLRLTPNLYLKQMVVGGFHRVFEIGSQFCNGLPNSMHIPEFTSCEFYATQMDHHDLMPLTQALLRRIVAAAGHGEELQVPYTTQGRPVILDFTVPFNQCDFLASLEFALGKPMPSLAEIDANSPDTINSLQKLCHSSDIKYEQAGENCGKLLDKLFGQHVQPALIQPTFVTKYPLCLCPLAKESPDFPLQAQHFKLYVAGKELANAHTVQNDPVKQRQMIEQHCNVVDEGYLAALECGLPPTAGWSMGLDRLFMILTNQTSIKEVIAFPTIKDKEHSTSPCTYGLSNKTVNVQNEQVDKSLSNKEYAKFRTDQLSQAGFCTYPFKFETTHSLMDVHDEFEQVLEASDSDKSREVRVDGRVHTIRKASKNLFFVDLKSGNHDRLQQKLISNEYKDGREQFEKDVSLLRRGDFVGVHGFPSKTKSGEMSLTVRSLSLLSPCMIKMVNNHVRMDNLDKRFRRRHLDWLSNPEKKHVLDVCHKTVKELRCFLRENGFREVRTPIINTKKDGAMAEKFEIFDKAIQQTMYMRVAPELYLKQMVVGGFHRIYEIGRQFRNEDADRTHNPEFTSCEFYATQMDHYDLMPITEVLLRRMVAAAGHRDKLQVPYTMQDKDVILDFAEPFKCYDFLGSLESALGKTLPHLDQMDANSPDAVNFLQELCRNSNIDCAQAGENCGKLLDKLFGHYVEPGIIQPTFVTNQPMCLSPLAKEFPDSPLKAQRFELYVAGIELANAYTEQNDPMKQRSMMVQHSNVVDEDFLAALECGLPPTAGWGMGLDRLIMILTNQSSIKEVIEFPTMKDKE